MKVPRGIPVPREVTYDYTAIDNKILSDIEEVLYTLQVDKDDDDTKYLIFRYSLNEIIIDDSTKNFSWLIDNPDFDKLVNDEPYNQIFSIKYNGDSIFRDYVLRENNGIDPQLFEVEGNWTQINT